MDNPVIPNVSYLILFILFLCVLKTHLSKATWAKGGVIGLKFKKEFNLINEKKGKL